MTRSLAAVGRALITVLTVVLGAVSLDAIPAQSSVDAAFSRFWNADSVRDAEGATADVIASGVSFDAALARLRQGRPYRRNVPMGIITAQRDGGFPYTLQIPEDYSPDQRYQVRVQLHGGVDRPKPLPNGEGIGRLAGAEQIYILPAGWRGAMWWTNAQTDNLRAIIDRVKRDYNVDENLIALSGTSDGGTGAYFLAMRDPTPFSSVLPLIGSIMVLDNPAIEADGDLYPSNLRNRPFFIVNGGKDRLYPTSLVGQTVTNFAKRGVETVYRPQPQAGHDTSWWPALKDEFEGFVKNHPRDPLPDHLTWETSDPERAGRLHWLVIDELGSTPSDAPTTKDMDDLNDFTLESGSDAGRVIQLFYRSKPSGRADVTRSGNHVDIISRGIKALTLLLSPDEFDFTQPITVVANGQVVFEDTVTPSLKTLMKWAARDNDRTMLFGAEVPVQVR